MAGAGAEDEAIRAVSRAQTAWNQRRIAEAYREARRAAQLAPRTLAAVLAHARMAEHMGEFDEAARAYAAAEALGPDDVGFLGSRAAFAFRIGDDAGGLERLGRIVARHSWGVRLLYTYAPARVQPWILREHPMLAEIVQLRADMAMERGDLARARDVALAYRLVEEGRPYCAEAQERMQESLGPDVLRDLRKAALGEPHNAHCIWWLGQMLTDEGFVRLGRVLVGEATRMVANNPALHASGERYMRIRLGAGREVPKRVEQLFVIGRQRYLRDRDAAGATRLLTEALRLAPHFARPYNYLARIAWDGGDRESAVVWLQRALEVDPESWRTHRNLGKTLAALGRLEAAEAHLRRTVELFDDDAGGRLALAQVLYARAKYPEYEAETERAVAFAQGYREELRDVRAFLAGFRIAGPGRALPPAPDPSLIRGWWYD
jgi:tetratricopeptide (TPR) repeat protein